MRLATPLILCLLLTLVQIGARPTLSTFKKLVLSEDFFSEGACFADLNGDGAQDIVSGPYWYAGPDFRVRHAYATTDRFPIAVYSRHFFSFAHDFNGDDRTDILAIPMPGRPAHWFENPGNATGHWAKHLALQGVGNESPTLTDLTGDGKPELICCHQGKLVYAEPNWDSPEKPWSITAISGHRGYGQFTHGLGVGEVNGDGRLDVLETNGWWEQPAAKGQLFKLHQVRFAESGGAQMFTDDVDGDGDYDVISVQNAHGYGLSWFEQIHADGQPQFQRHAILTDNPKDNPYGLSISQMHAAALADIDGDGLKDIITGKRYWAHGGRDPGAQELPLLYWFRNVRSDQGVHFQPWLIDERSGVGTQLTVGEVTGDGLADIVIGNKLGTFVFTHQRREVSDEVFRQTQPKPTENPAHVAGTDLFAKHVRTTQPLAPGEEGASFVVAQGFEVQLVASEPDIAKPMNMAFDARGRLWVSSSLEYPFAAPPDRKPRDTIKILEDTTGDGYADKITTFADGLNIPMGLYPYQDGVVCFSIPNIWFLRDTDGDDVADLRQRLYGPFDHTRDTHGMCNGFRRGLDGWLYACHGFNNHSDVSGTDRDSISLHSGNIFRMRLDGSRIEQVAHGQVNPFGMTFDRYGNLFTADCHTKPINLVLPGGYHDSFGKPHDGLGYVPDVMRHLHRSTGIAGIALGEATHFPEVYQNSAFIGNVVTSRINRNRLLHRGSSIVAEEESDFLIAGDPWFRPVDLQVGPDGALYVADFYNCVIGHYEVPLTHPKRDRHRGRIWRILYQPEPGRRDAPGRAPAPMLDLGTASAGALIRSLAEATTGHQSKRIVDELSLRHDAELAGEIRAAIKTAPPEAEAYFLWTLFRLGVLQPQEISRASHSSSTFLRLHAYHILAEYPGHPQFDHHVIQGLLDEQPPVRRAAATAAARQPSPPVVPALIQCARDLPAGDVHLRHAIKIALKKHLQDGKNFQQLNAAPLPLEDRQLVAEVCLALDHATAGHFVVMNLDALDADPETMARYLRFAARSTGPESVSRIVALARVRYSEDPAIQLELLTAIRQGLEQRGFRVTQPTPEIEPLRQWATSMAENWFGSADESVETLAWIPSAFGEDNPWQPSTKRSSSDGEKHSSLWSSFPRGEQRTGSFRSASFALGESFHFYLAGHDGPPSRPRQGRNWVRLREANSDEIIHATHPPGTDIAQPVTWDTSAHAGRAAYVELVDGDSGRAFAWLAAGRFSVEGLNPTNRPAEQRLGAELVRDFHLQTLKPLLADFLTRERLHSGATPSIAQAYVSLSKTGEVLSPILALALELPIQHQDLRRLTVKALVAADAARLPDLLKEWMNALPRPGQIRLAERLSQTPQGAATLLNLVEGGQASAGLLKLSTIAELLAKSLGEAQRSAVSRLTRGLPDEDRALEETIAQRIRSYGEHGGDPGRGKAIFTQHCALCHQISGEGTALGPNLDGIGHRGLARLSEDVLAPHRNVDVAFRLTSVTTHAGQTHLGLIKRTAGAQLVLADIAGNEFTIPVDSVKEKTPLALSLMPAAYADALSEADFRDLQAYLLSLRN